MFYFSDLHVQLLARGILNPGEQLVGQTSTFYMPWWAMGFINRRHLVLATDQRLIVVEHRFGFFPVGYRVHVVQSMPWASVQEAKLKGIFTKKLKVVAHAFSASAKAKIEQAGGSVELIETTKTAAAAA